MRIDAVHGAYLALDAAGGAGEPDPVVVFQVMLAGQIEMDEQPILVCDLAQPGVLSAPGVVHMHGALGDGA